MTDIQSLIKVEIVFLNFVDRRGAETFWFLTEGDNLMRVEVEERISLRKLMFLQTSFKKLSELSS